MSIPHYDENSPFSYREQYLRRKIKESYSDRPRKNSLHTDNRDPYEREEAREVYNNRMDKHKYLYKVRTKSGKWRYVYEVPDGKGKTRKISYANRDIIEDAQFGNKANHFKYGSKYKNLNRERREDVGRDLMTQVNSISKNLPKGRLNNVKISIKRIAAMAPTLGNLAVQQGADYIDDGLAFINNTIYDLRNGITNNLRNMF